MALRVGSPQPALDAGSQRPPAPQASDGDDSSSRINVAVRCRPLSDAERCSGAHDICRVMDQRLVILMDPGAAATNDYLRADKSREKRYAFDRAFGPEAGTQEVYEATTRPLVAVVMQAYNATVFAYGSTGAGKTFTMIGTQQEPGVMLRTVKALFERAAQARVGDGGAGKAVAIRCSFVEVYNENLRDLLSKDGREACLDLREDPEKGTCVAGVTETEPESVDEVMELLHAGNRRRTTEPTAMNVTSSRSHAVLQVSVEQREAEQPCNALLGKLSMIDLAGSERASQTDNRGARLVEGANINRSLLALGNCINALASGSAFVPYRDSKLTRLLKDSLGGNCRTVMVANVSPNHHLYEDTLNTLKYANRAKNIRVSARQNLLQPQRHVNQYERAIADLRSEVLLLKAKLAERGAPASLVQELGAESGPGDEHLLQEASEHWKEEVVKNLECRTQLQRSLIEVDRGLAQWRDERERARSALARWDARPGPGSPAGPGVTPLLGPGPRTYEDWQDHLAQIEESVRENAETRRSLEERLEQNRAAGKELHAQLPRRVLNEDLRAFLELVQRVQVLEVERLELDHAWERQRAQLEERDRETAMLREQLRLRNGHIRAQRERLSAEQRQQLPGRVSLLGSTLAEASPVQPRGALQVMHAWAPPPLEPEELGGWDNRPLRERQPVAAHGQEDGDARLGALPLASVAQGIDWKNLEVPRASRIRGVARLQPPGSCQRLAPKGWREPPELRMSPQPQLQSGLQPVVQRGCDLQPKPATGSVLDRRPPQCPSPPRRGNTCPPLQRPSSLDVPAFARRASSGTEEMAEAPRRPAPRPGALRAQGLAPPLPRPGPGEKAATPGRRRLRARSEHSGARMGRVGRILVHTPGR